MEEPGQTAPFSKISALILLRLLQVLAKNKPGFLSSKGGIQIQILSEGIHRKACVGENCPCLLSITPHGTGSNQRLG